MGYQYFPFSQSQGYDPQTCADACNVQTTYDSENRAADGSYTPCVSKTSVADNVLPLTLGRFSSMRMFFLKMMFHKGCIARCIMRHGMRLTGRIMDSIRERISILFLSLTATRLCKSMDFLRFDLPQSLRPAIASFPFRLASIAARFDSARKIPYFLLAKQTFILY